MLSCYSEWFETYISNHSDAVCTNSLCPDCEAKAGEKYAKILEDYMNQEEAFLEENISVQQVSKTLESPHHLSMTINIEFEQNFYNYVNCHRIRYAENLLVNPDGSEEPILMIAYRSGFQSKTAFNKIFKSFTGTTPSEYRKVNCQKFDKVLD